MLTYGRLLRELFSLPRLTYATILSLAALSALLASGLLLTRFALHALGPSDVDRIEFTKQRLATAKALLPTTGVISYVTDKPIPDDDQATWRYYRTQYVLCPLVVTTGPHPGFVLCDAPSESEAQVGPPARCPGGRELRARPPPGTDRGGALILNAAIAVLPLLTGELLVLGLVPRPWRSRVGWVVDGTAGRVYGSSPHFSALLFLARHCRAVGTRVCVDRGGGLPALRTWRPPEPRGGKAPLVAVCGSGDSSNG